MFGRKKSQGGFITNSIKRNLIDGMMRDMTSDDRPSYSAPRESQYNIIYLPRGQRNLSISQEKYNVLPPSLRKIWTRIDLDALFAVEEEPQDLPQLEEPTDPKQDLLDNPIVKDSPPLRASILSETEEEE